MVKPRMIILIRHAQSEGNKNREIHQVIPDHRVKLTEDGWKQAEEAGRRLRKLLKPDDTLQIFTSPYRRTRETTEGILKTFTAQNDPDDPSAAPSPFSRSKIKVYEEPRIREQDFGNFQPCSAEMERMWDERADYGHFFYRIPNGESAADAYDRISGFNESLWRQFGDAEFPSVCVLVTHGLMTRVFLMKWYHWSVEYFEDLRNINHCEFIVMEKNIENGKYVLENQLRTWSELKRQRQAEEARYKPQRRNTLSHFLSNAHESPRVPSNEWAGCTDGLNHEHDPYLQQAMQKQKSQTLQDLKLPGPVESSDVDWTSAGVSTERTDFESHATSKPDQETLVGEEVESTKLPLKANHVSRLSHDSGRGTPHEMSEDESLEYFGTTRGRSLAHAMRKAPKRKATPEDVARWVSESGMGSGTKADALGDEPSTDSDGNDGVVEGNNEQSAAMSAVEMAEKEDKSLRGSIY